MRKRLLLDVGCGSNGVGTVNCDLFVEDTHGHRAPHSNESREKKQEMQDRSYRIDSRKLPNFVMCDAQYLPFADETFQYVNCSHLIEHVKNPFNLLKELVRVASFQVIIECPHMWGDALESQKSIAGWRWVKKHHINKFNFRWFQIASKHLNLACEESVVKSKGFPMKTLSLITVPIFIQVKLTKLVMPLAEEMYPPQSVNSSYEEPLVISPT